jgi:hypothetical protein
MPVVYSIQNKLRTSKKSCTKEWLVPVPHIKLSTDVNEELTMEAMLESASTPGRKN